MKTIGILNLKGGVAKTTTAINLARNLAAEHEKRVLIVDADSQANVTSTLLPPGDYNTVADLLLRSGGCVMDFLYPSAIRGLDVVPSAFKLALVGMPRINHGTYSRRALVDLRDDVAEADFYDYIIIDFPSAFIHPGCQAAILAVDELIIPVVADAYSVLGAEELAEQVENFHVENPALRVAGCLITKYHSEKYVNSTISRFRETAPVRVFSTQIRTSPKANGGTESDEGIMGYSPRSALAIDYRAFVAEYLGGEGK